MKVIAIGDPHFRTDNIPEVNLFIERIETLCKKENPDFIVVLGDLLHTHERIHTIPLNKAYELISRLSNLALTFVLVGNHDMISNMQFLTENHWMNGLKRWKNVKIVDKVINFDIDDYRFVFSPYVSPGRFLEALETLEVDWKTATCIFAHQEFFGCKMGAIISTEGDKWDSSYPCVISGHIHSRQTLENVYYCGSSLQHAFGENENNIIPILEWKSEIEEYKLKEINLDLPRKRIVYTELDEINSEEFVLEGKSQDKIKISVSGNYEEFKAFKKTKKYREIISKGNKIIFKPRKIDLIEESETIEELKTREENEQLGFNSILQSLIETEDNKYLFDLYKTLLGL